MSWTVFIESDIVRHVIPLDDEKEHDDSSHEEDWPFGIVPVCNCSCHPRREYEDNICIFIHSSFDGREGLEWAKDILNK